MPHLYDLLLSHPSSSSSPFFPLPSLAPLPSLREKKSLEGCRRYVYVIRFAPAHPPVRSASRPPSMLIPQCLVDKEPGIGETFLRNTSSDRGTAICERLCIHGKLRSRSSAKLSERIKEIKSDGRKESNGISEPLALLKPESAR